MIEKAKAFVFTLAGIDILLLGLSAVLDHYEPPMQRQGLLAQAFIYIAAKNLERIVTYRTRTSVTS